MNVGEKNEFLLKIYLTYLRDNNPKLKTCFGPIKSVGFGEKEYKDGKAHGKYTFWNENGQIESESNWEYDECISGDCVSFYD